MTTVRQEYSPQSYKTKLRINFNAKLLILLPSSHVQLILPSKSLQYRAGNATQSLCS